MLMLLQKEWFTCQKKNLKYKQKYEANNFIKAFIFNFLLLNFFFFFGFLLNLEYYLSGKDVLKKTKKKGISLNPTLSGA